MALIEYQRFVLAKELGVNDKSDSKLSDLYYCCQFMKICNELLVRPMRCHDCDFNNRCRHLDQRHYYEIRVRGEAVK